LGSGAGFGACGIGTAAGTKTFGFGVGTGISNGEIFLIVFGLDGEDGADCFFDVAIVSIDVLKEI
jgi:hypothetical protein